MFTRRRTSGNDSFNLFEFTIAQHANTDFAAGLSLGDLIHYRSTIQNWLLVHFEQNVPGLESCLMGRAVAVNASYQNAKSFFQAK